MYDDGGWVHVGKREVFLEQAPCVGDKLFLKGFDKPVKIVNREWKNGSNHYFGCEVKK